MGEEGSEQLLLFKEGKECKFSELVIESDRMKLVPISEQFANDIFKEFTAEITRYMYPKAATSVDEALGFIRASQENMQAGSELICVATDKGSGEFLGVVGLHGRGSASSPDLGLWFKKAAHGQGLGKEGIYALVAWARDTLKLESFRYPVDRNNIPSRKIPESLSGVVVEELQGPTMDPERILDEVIFEIPVTNAEVQAL